MKSPERVIVDTSYLVALCSQDDDHHKACHADLAKHPANTKYYSIESCISEFCFLLPGSTFFDALCNLKNSLPIQIESLHQRQWIRAFELLKKYEDASMDFADAALVTIAESLNITAILTLDRRDFQIYRPKHVKSLTIFP